MSDQCSETEKNRSIGDRAYLAKKKHKTSHRISALWFFFTEEKQKLLFPILLWEPSQQRYKDVTYKYIQKLLLRV